MLRRDGRVVDYNGLENRRAERHRGFESLSLRGFPKFGMSKTLILNGLAFFHAQCSQTFRFFAGTFGEHLGNILRCIQTLFCNC